MLLAMEKRRKFASKKSSGSTKSFDSMSTDGELSSSFSEDAVSTPVKEATKKSPKHSILKLSKPSLNASFLFNKKSSVDKEEHVSSLRRPLPDHVNGDVNMNIVKQPASEKRPSWEMPWTCQWDAKRDLEQCTRSTGSLKPGLTSNLTLLNNNRKNQVLYKSCDHLQNQSNDLKALSVFPSNDIKQMTQSALDLNANITLPSEKPRITNGTASHHKSHDLLLKSHDVLRRANRDTSLPSSRRNERPQQRKRPVSMTSSHSEINPAALAEIAVS